MDFNQTYIDTMLEGAEKVDYILVTLALISRLPAYKDCINQLFLHTTFRTSGWILNKFV